MSVPTTPEVPQAALSDSVITGLQPLVAMGLLVFSLVDVRPLGGSGLGLLIAVLLVVCTVQAFSRSVPDRWLPARVRLVSVVVGTVAAGLLFGIASPSWGTSWAYLVSGHVGFRYPPRLAVALAGLTATVATVVLLTGPHGRGEPWPWWTGPTVVGAAVVGLSRQNRLRTLANARELVLQTRRAVASEAEAATLAERNRIARELHDVLAHSLSGVSLQLDAADALIEAGRLDDGRVSLQKARALVVDGLVQARGAVQTLRADDMDLREALGASLADSEELRACGPLETLPGPIARACLRIVQEAVTNARRHAPGAPVLVSVRLDRSLHVGVENQSPASPAAPFGLGGGMGLVGIRERVESHGGTFAAGPTPTGGWSVVVELPVGTEQP